MAYCAQCGKEIEDGRTVCLECAAAETATLNNVPNTTAEYDLTDIQENKIKAVLAYFGVLVFVPLLTASNSKFAKFHANQGILLLIANAVNSVIVSILNIIPYLGTIIGLFLSLFTLILSVIGIVNAAQGQAKELPLIGKYRLVK